MASKSKQKGNRFEYLIRDLAIEYGLDAKKVPLSGAAKDFKSDILINGFPYECKSRSKAPFSTIYKYMKDVRGLFIKIDREPPLVVVDARHYFTLLSFIKVKDSNIDKQE
jgi:hypothetical protein